MGNRHRGYDNTAQLNHRGGGILLILIGHKRTVHALLKRIIIVDACCNTNIKTPPFR